MRRKKMCDLNMSNLKQTKDHQLAKRLPPVLKLIEWKFECDRMQLLTVERTCNLGLPETGSRQSTFISAEMFRKQWLLFITNSTFLSTYVIQRVKAVRLIRLLKCTGKKRFFFSGKKKLNYQNPRLSEWSLQS